MAATHPDAPSAAPSNRELSIILTKLVAFGEMLPESAEFGDYDPPDTDYQALYQSIGERFPEFGFYASATPVDDEGWPDPHAGVSDAIDDLADIYIDLSRSVQVAGINGQDAGIAYARLLFGHWGAHVINLKHFLHQRLFGFS